ncbi:hypothetical protein SEA_SKOG_98 [Gordonia phage Skog]|uniref:Uncharacterized protein n=1 Tax=Gordonia phage Skog TaxID=2704033 RepID=A0A6G6XKF9_9CAUD|nr:hypothetical protein KHQ85_gp098 [Gordonia phage Skog]QIG58250.1 hypothetical protein SEA_SKOG_98 [Gordonia phage Skog]
MTTKTGKRETAQMALKALGEKNGWAVTPGKHSERHLYFTRQSEKIAAEFFPGGSLKGATRYMVSASDPDSRVIVRNDPERRKKLEAWLRREAPTTPPADDLTTGTAEPTGFLVMHNPEVQSAIEFTEWTALPYMSFQGCLVCGSVVFDQQQHRSWHERLKT